MSTLRTEPCDVTYQHLAHDWRAPASWARCPGIRIDLATRARPVHTRRHVLAELRSIVGFLHTRINRWNVTGVEWDGAHPVPRRVDEFPENTPDAWGVLARTCTDLMADLAQLRTFAEQQQREVYAFNRRESAKLRGGDER